MNEAEMEIRQLIDRWIKAFRTKDLDGVMSIYAPGSTLVAFDIVPPLRLVGAASYRKNYEEFFAQYEGPIDVEIRDLAFVTGADVAFGYCLDRIGGKLKNGQRSDLWVRVTDGYRKIDGRWFVTHEHVSVPVDFETGRALLELKP